MELKIYQADPNKDAVQIRELFWEYLQWANAKVNEMYGVSFEIITMLEEDMLHLDQFLPPKGRLLLGCAGEEPAGIACLRDNGDGMGEIKRMYVRPASRRQGVGRALLVRLLEEAGSAGYRCIRLDSAGFMGEAHQLYRSLGFQEIAPYAASEIPPEFQANWIFMEKVLSENR
jgi:GNAT superfamily N-acetyltransferase